MYMYMYSIYIKIDMPSEIPGENTAYTYKSFYPADTLYAVLIKGAE